ncbi:MAG: sugar O-acetyltransferase, partial [bacterium]|nr:sugar O-acetyltransferase [bacterium]
MTNPSDLYNGTLFLTNPDELNAEELPGLELQARYNQTAPSDMEERKALLQQMFAEIGEGSMVMQPFHSNWGGKRLHLGKNVFANVGLTVLDGADIYIGDNTMIGPNVQMIASSHPVEPELREQGYLYCLPVTIGRNCWIGAGAIILPGITIGDQAIIGAGSVVTKDIPANVVAVGSPCRVIRNLSMETNTK